MPRLRRGAFVAMATVMLIGAYGQPVSAQNSGPAQQEFSVPGGSGDGAGVDEFTGAFTFDLPLLQVPGPHGSGYDITLTYRSGASPAGEASWVGYGWTLNPGAISRNPRGFADDWKDSVIYWNKRKKNWTVTAKRKLNAEITSADFNKFVQVNADSSGSGSSGQLQLSITTIFNNYTGYSRSAAFGAWAKGLGNLTYTVSDGEGSFSGAISPNVFLRGLQFAGLYGNNNVSEKMGQAIATTTGAATAVLNTLLSYETRIPPLSMVPMRGGSKNYTANFLLSIFPWFLSGFEAGVSGNYTWQELEHRINRTGLGYMHSSIGSSDPLAVMDYYTEKELPYYKDNLFLPIPFNSADNFTVAGSGFGGSFRLHNRGLGAFRPNFVESEIGIEQFGVDLHAGLRFGIGGDLGIGKSTYRVEAWDDRGNNSSYGFEKEGDGQPFIFRFGNDPGGKIELAENDDPVRASIDDAPSLLLPVRYPKIPSSIFPKVNNGQAPTAASAIAFHTNKEMTAQTDKGILYNSYNKDTLSRKLVDRTQSQLADQIGEFCIYNAGGYRFVYGLPVYARAEKNINLGLGRLSLDSAARLKSNYIAHAYENTGTAPLVVGEERYAPYATTYLLTEITTPDYVDRTNNGPTPDDYGGYTKFNYVRVAGANNKVTSSNNLSWYSWRLPYNGFLYSKNSLSDPSDDLGTFLTGQKEIYYLRSIETKTHMAIFVTNRTNVLYGSRRIKGSMEVRKDAYQSYHPTFTAASIAATEAKIGGDSTISEARYNLDFNGGKYPQRNFAERLERVELYVKDENGNPGVLLSTVNLEYDYSLRNGMPNSIRPTSANDTAQRVGMLTLRKVWWREQNVVNGEYSPFTFSYDYRRANQYGAAINDRYPAITHFADSLSSAEQNPDYSPFHLDRWGNYQLDGAARYAKLAPWVSQISDSTKFDPAAWQLKRIQTPSQGEIQVQYEQNSYSYVQDKTAMAMVSLAPDRSSDGDNTKYYLNVADIGIADTSRMQVMQLRSLLMKTFTEANAGGMKEKIYFKLLYALTGMSPSLDHPEYSSEYIQGYSPVEKIEIDSANSTPKRYRIYVALKGDNGVPKSICLEYVKKNRRGLLGPEDGLVYSDNHAAMITKLMGVYAAAGFEEENHCKSIDYANSYLRIPLLLPKKGGGVRVKRLLYFDKGLERDTTLYGVEYAYEEFDERLHRYIGSGVAVNEPSVGREENALVNVWPGSEKPDLANRIIAGKDQGRFEGVIGESLLPSASVGYSRVVAKNIHSGKSHPGFSVASFYTAKDFPFVRNYDHAGKSVHYTDIDTRSFQLFPFLAATQAISPVSLMKYQDDLWLSQGYRFILNEMHGRFRSRAAYGGNYSNQDSWSLSSMQEISYYSPGEKVPMMTKPGDSLRLDNPGKTMDISIDSRRVFDHTIDGKVEGDLSIQSFIPFDIQPSGKAALTLSSNTLSTHVTSKVIRYPVIQKGVLSYTDGIYHYTQYEAFDPLTGRPLLSHTVDGYDRLVLQRSAATGHIGAYHSYQFPAAQYYREMGGKMNNERVRLKTGNGLTITKTLGMMNSIRLAISSTDARILCDARQRIAPGDLIRLTFTSDKSLAGFYHVDSVSLSDMMIAYLLPVSPTSFAAANTTTGNVDVEVIRSGYTNQIATNAGEVTTYGVPESAIQIGSDITSPAGQQSTGRQQLAIMLNGLLQSGGNLTSQQVSALGITMRHPVTGTCSALSVWINPNYNGQLVISVVEPAATAVSKNYLLRSGNNPGAFAIDGSGRLVYNAYGNTCCPQDVTCIDFCPKYNGEVMTGVVASSAATFDHRQNYDTVEFPPALGDGNPYELGTKGKWRLKTAYTYRTGTRGGSERISTERSYANAGVFDDFTLFNWKYEDANNFAKWLRLDTVVRYSPHGDSRELKDVTGIASAAGNGFDNNIPLFDAGNATASSVAFQSFEDNWGTAGAAHSGSHSKMLLGSLSHAPFISVKATAQTLAKGLSLRFWLKVSDYAIVENAIPPAWIDIYMNNGGGATPWYRTFRVGQSHKIAQTGEWTLYEVIASDFNGVAANDPINIGITTNLRMAGSTIDTVWIDDVRLQPLDAEMNCYVYDRKTMRLAAVLDDQHFGTYNQYNAEGRLVRQVAESDRGMRTILESHDHLPMISRVDNGEAAEGGGGGEGQSATRRKGSSGGRSRAGRAAVPQFETNGPDTKVDLLDFELGPDGAKVRTFGSKGLKPFDPSSLDSIDLDAIGLPGLPGLDPRAGLRRVAELEERQRELIARRGEGLTKEEQEAIDAEVGKLVEERKELLESLGLNEEKWLEARERIESLESTDEVEETEEEDYE